MRVNQVVPELAVADVLRSVAFYETVLGFRAVATAPEGGQPTWAELENGSARIMLQRIVELIEELPIVGDRSLAGAALLVLRVDSAAAVEELYSGLDSAVTVVMPIRHTDYGTVEFAIADPDQHVTLVSGE